jgi:transposase
MVQDLTRARNRLSGFLLRHSVVWRGGSPWTERHRRWLAALSFDDRAIAATYSHYLATVKLRETALESVEAISFRGAHRTPSATKCTLWLPTGA